VARLEEGTMTAPRETEMDRACSVPVEAPPLPRLPQVEHAARQRDPDRVTTGRLAPFLRTLLRALSAWPV
jgi:hypothetical protein